MKALELVRKSLPVLASVCLLSLAFPPTNVSLLVLVALAPWLASLRDTDAKGAKRSGYLFGLLYFLFQMFWLVPFVGKWTGSYLLACVPWVLAAAIAGLYYMTAGWLVNRCWASGAVWAVPLVWAGVEAFRSYVYVLAFPWGIVAYPLWSSPALAQHAAIGTIFLVSASVVLVNVLIASFVWPPKDERRRLGRRESLAFASFLAVLLAFSLVRFSEPNPGKVKVYSVAQTGVDMAFGNPQTQDADIAKAVDVVMAFSSSQGASAVLFPEGIAGPSDTLPPDGPVKPVGPTAVIFGGNRVEDGKTYQTAYAYDGEWTYANKTRLVIFGEFVPFRSYLPFLQGFNLPSGDLDAAQRLTTLEVDGTKVGAMLCFEGLFPDLAERHCRNGAQVLAVMAIDDWYAGTPAYQQLAGSSAWRSIESGLPMLRSSCLGTTYYTDSRGRASQPAEQGKLAALRAEVSVPAGSDAFDYRFGFVWVCWLAIAWVYASHFLSLRGR